MHEKTNDWAQWTNEFDALQQLHKNCSSTFHGMMFLFIHTKIFHISFQRLEWMTENTPFVQAMTQIIVLHTANLSIYEIKELTSKGMISCSGN